MSEESKEPEKEKEEDDSNAGGKTAVDIITGQDSEIDATDLIRDPKVVERLRKIKLS